MRVGVRRSLMVLAGAAFAEVGWSRTKAQRHEEGKGDEGGSSAESHGFTLRRVCGGRMVSHKGTKARRHEGTKGDEGGSSAEAHGFTPRHICGGWMVSHRFGKLKALALRRAKAQDTKKG
jgi:hypothetical protein